MKVLIETALLSAWLVAMINNSNNQPPKPQIAKTHATVSPAG
jgi:hypothetical protein